MTTNKPESLPIWRAEDEWNDDEVVVRLSDYEALKAECEKLRKDAERLEWAVEHPNIRIMGRGNSWSALDSGNGLTFITRGALTMRDAIDAAMQKRSG